MNLYFSNKLKYQYFSIIEKFDHWAHYYITISQFKYNFLFSEKHPDTWKNMFKQVQSLKNDSLEGWENQRL